MSVILLPEPTGAALLPAGSSSRPTLVTNVVTRSRPIGARIARWISRAIRESQFRRAARELRMLDDRMLHDIGITRSEIDSIVRNNPDADRSPLRQSFGLYARDV